MAPGQVQVPQKSLSWLLLAVTLAHKLLDSDTSNLHEYVLQLRLRACALRTVGDLTLLPVEAR